MVSDFSSLFAWSYHWFLDTVHMSYLFYRVYSIHYLYCIYYVCVFLFLCFWLQCFFPSTSRPTAKIQVNKSSVFPAALKLRCSGQRFHCTKVAWISFGFWTYYILAPVRNCYVTCSQGRAGMNSEALWRLQRVTLACGKLRMRCFWCLFYDILCFYRQQMNFWSGHHLHI